MRVLLLSVLSVLMGPCPVGPARSSQAVVQESPSSAVAGDAIGTAQGPDAQGPAQIAPLQRVEREGVDPLVRVGPILLAGQPTQAALELLRREGATAVIDLRLESESRGFDEPAVARALGLSYRRLGFGGDVALSDELLDTTCALLGAQRSAAHGDLVLHDSSGARVGAVWLASRALDEGVEWQQALAQAHAVGLQSGALEDQVRDYVLGAGNSELGRYKREIRGKWPDVGRITVAELAGRMTLGRAPLLLDVRAPQEYAVSHLQGARSTPTSTAALEILREVPRDREIVVYCSIGYRSASMAQALQARGFSRVRNLEGSIFEWANTGHALYREPQRVFEVHPFDEKWGRMLDRKLWSEIE